MPELGGIEFQIVPCSVCHSQCPLDCGDDCAKGPPTLCMRLTINISQVPEDDRTLEITQADYETNYGRMPVCFNCIKELFIDFTEKLKTG